MTYSTSYFCLGCLCALVKGPTGMESLAPFIALLLTTKKKKKNHSAQRIFTHHKMHRTIYGAGRGGQGDIYMEVMPANLKPKLLQRPATMGSGGQVYTLGFIASCLISLLPPSSFLPFSKIITPLLLELQIPSPFSILWGPLENGVFLGFQSCFCHLLTQQLGKVTYMSEPGSSSIKQG